jgi:glyoxylase-like metal-dependent hydrolase (beta-lactamase superfamily II)
MYDLFAIRYATFQERKAHDNFAIRDMHDGAMPLDYFVWIARQGDKTILIDTGFNADAGMRRNRLLTVAPTVALERIGIAPASITDVVVTHLHYDHAGNLDKFPNARFHIQRREMAYATGPCMCDGFFRHPFDCEPVVQMVRFLYADRVVFHDGQGPVCPGIDVHLVGGHSDGLQIVNVATARGPVVVASDALHFYDNMRRGNPFPLLYSAGDMVEGWKTISRLVDGDASRIVAGHDPKVAQLFPRVRGTDIEMFALHEAASAG